MMEPNPIHLEHWVNGLSNSVSDLTLLEPNPIRFRGGGKSGKYYRRLRDTTALPILYGRKLAEVAGVGPTQRGADKTEQNPRVGPTHGRKGGRSAVAFRSNCELETAAPIRLF